MSATLILHKNPLAPFNVDTVHLADGARVIDWLQECYPDGCGGSLTFHVNGKERDLDDLDYAVAPDDVVDLRVYPCGLEPIYVQIIIAVVLAAVSFAINMLFLKKPQPPAFAKSDLGQPSPVYSVRSQQNTARIGEPVPVVYGEVLHTPDICAQPYVFNSSAVDQYFDLLLCLGQGQMEVAEILLGDTPSTAIATNDFQTDIITPARHLGRVGNFNNVFEATNGTIIPFVEDMLTSPEVGEQSFENLGDRAGWFRLGKSGQRGRFIHIDLEFPRGLYQVMDAGDWTNTAVDVRVQVIECDASGTAIGALTEYNRAPGTINGTNPCRFSYTIDLGKSAMWLVLMYRNTLPEPNGGEINNWVWKGLRMTVDSSAGQVAYGDATLLACRIRANKLSSTVQNMVRVRLRRVLPILGNPALVQFTANPADAFVDIITNTVYGARRPLAEVDVARLNTLWNYWWTPTYRYSFNAVYTGKTTVWEALSDTMDVVAASPLPLGGFMSVVQDGPKPVRTMLFTEQNIVRDTFKLMFSFDEVGAPDGIEVEYRDPQTFAPAFVRVPTASADPEKIQLFGCTNLDQATQAAQLRWNRRALNRRVVNFETELEGLVPVLGDRVAVAHTLPRWGQSGFIAGVNADRITITLDRKLKWNEVAPPYYMVFRSEIGGVSTMVQVSRGPSDDIAILASDPWATVDGDWSVSPTQERTHFSWGDGQRVVKDFILTNLAPKGGKRVEVEGVYYAPTVYDNTFVFLQLPVP